MKIVPHLHYDKDVVSKVHENMYWWFCIYSMSSLGGISL